MAPILEICTNSIHSALAAKAGGANRIELCQDLEHGGITPSYGLIKAVQASIGGMDLFVLIRPRPGNFVYDDHEFEIMRRDIELCRDLGCNGVVLGVLDETGRVDLKRCKELVDLARPMQVTFHRAFDDCQNQERALEQVIEMGCERVLTSGGQASAIDGIEQIARLVKQAKGEALSDFRGMSVELMSPGRIIIMPGAGITSYEVRRLLDEAGVKEVHASAKRCLPPAPGVVSLFSSGLLETDPTTVANMVRLMNK